MHIRVIWGHRVTSKPISYNHGPFFNKVVPRQSGLDFPAISFQIRYFQQFQLAIIQTIIFIFPIAVVQFNFVHHKTYYISLTKSSYLSSSFCRYGDVTIFIDVTKSLVDSDLRCLNAHVTPLWWYLVVYGLKTDFIDFCQISYIRWCHNGRDGVSNRQPHDCLLNRLFRRRSKKTSKLCVTGLCAGNSPVPGEFPAQIASNAETVSISWRHHDIRWCPPGWEDGPLGAIQTWKYLIIFLISGDTHG